MSATATSCRFARADEQYSTSMIWNTCPWASGKQYCGSILEYLWCLLSVPQMQQSPEFSLMISRVPWYMKKAANAIRVKDPWLPSNSSLEKTIAPSSGNKWAVTVLGLALPKEAPQDINSYHPEKIGCSDQRLLQQELNKEPPDYNNLSHLKRREL